MDGWVEDRGARKVKKIRKKRGREREGGATWIGSVLRLALL